ncbi:hypothetical protein PLICRDRAFT_214189 [Plicaturopsis crispa FD-325 SS-3]|nr:hypothetical protein PLICRDRAFT_214189 [Plicaturopsis crispa FD-325 SS-3]
MRRHSRTEGPSMLLQNDSRIFVSSFAPGALNYGSCKPLVSVFLLLYGLCGRSKCRHPFNWVVSLRCGSWRRLPPPSCMPRYLTTCSCPLTIAKSNLTVFLYFSAPLFVPPAIQSSIRDEHNSAIYGPSSLTVVARQLFALARTWLLYLLSSCNHRR